VRGVTIHDLTTLAAALHSRQDLAVAVVAVLATRAASDGMQPYEVLLAVRYVAPEVDADEAAVDSILIAGHAADLLTRYQHRGLWEYGLTAERRFAVARHHGGALGWLREQCASVPDAGSPRSLSPAEQRERQIAEVARRLPEAMRYDRDDEVAALRAEIAALRSEVPPVVEATAARNEGGECAVMEE
jgi:hypothetical protein